MDGVYRRAVVVDEAHRMRNKNSALLGCLQQVGTGLGHSTVQYIALIVRGDGRLLSVGTQL